MIEAGERAGTEGGRGWKVEERRGERKKIGALMIEENGSFGGKKRRSGGGHAERKESKV